MNNMKVRKTKGKAFKWQMSNKRFCVKELFAGYAREVFSIGKYVSDASNQQVYNTSLNVSSRLMLGGEETNNTKRSLNMNITKKTLGRGVRRIFCGRSVSVAHKQKISNTSLNTSSRLVVELRIKTR